MKIGKYMRCNSRKSARFGTGPEKLEHRGGTYRHLVQRTVEARTGAVQCFRSLYRAWKRAQPGDLAMKFWAQATGGPRSLASTASGHYLDDLRRREDLVGEVFIPHLRSYPSNSSQNTSIRSPIIIFIKVLRTTYKVVTISTSAVRTWLSILKNPVKV